MGNCINPKKKGRRFVKSLATVVDLKATYDIDQKVLGAGSYGKVFLACDKKDKDFRIAIKVINKSQLSEEDLESLKNEVGLMQTVDHPNIVKYYETYDDKKYIYLCMELCTGGELYENMMKSGKTYKEKEAATLMQKLLRAL